MIKTLCLTRKAVVGKKRR